MAARQETKCREIHTGLSRVDIGADLPACCRAGRGWLARIVTFELPLLIPTRDCGAVNLFSTGIIKYTYGVAFNLFGVTLNVKHDPVLRRPRNGAVFLAGISRRWSSIARIAARRLQAVDFASAMEDLPHPPGHRLEKLKGDRKGRWSIRIDDPCCVSFAGMARMHGTLRSSIIAKEIGPMSIARKPDKRGVPIHPGEFLREDFLRPWDFLQMPWPSHCVFP